MVPRIYRAPLALMVFSALCAASPRAAHGFALDYRYRLSTLTGFVPLSWATLSYDPQANELFVIGDGVVRIFNQAGMEEYRFGDDAALGGVAGIVALEDGDLVALTYRGGTPSLWRLNFRGVPKGELKLRGIPEEFSSGLAPTVLAYAKGQLYLADLSAMKVIVVRVDGGYVAGHDLRHLGDPEKDDGKRGDAEQREESPADASARELAMLSGFGVDRDGNLLVTVAPVFKAFVISPDGQIRKFGKPGGAPGKFGIVGGIAADDAGRIYVADKLKGVVMVFDRSFQFLGEYGYAGPRSQRLVGPDAVAVGNGKVYVAQNGRRGVSVFDVGE